MKRIVSLLIAACILAGSSVSMVKAQVNINVNIGAQPLWGPTGYDAVEYYYLPDLQMYYHVPSHRFVYLSNGRWQFVSSLPPRYRSYDLYSAYKVVINEPKPYLRFASHRAKYGKYKGWKGKQVVIRNSKEPKYHVVKGHPGNAKGHYKQQGPGNSGGDKGPGQGRGNAPDHKGKGQGPGQPGSDHKGKEQGPGQPGPDHDGGKEKKKGN